MLFSKCKYNQDITINIDGNVINKVSSTKLLGIHIDDQLTWKEHINTVYSKVSKSLSILYRTKSLLNLHTLVTLYNCLILPYLMYCCEIWGNTSKSNVPCLSLIQKRVVRLINNANYIVHCNQLFYLCQLLKFSDLVKYKTAIVMYKAENMMLPTFIQKFFDKSDVHDDIMITRQCAGNNFKVKYTRTTLKSMCLTICGVKLWNNLDKNLKKAKDVHLFKKCYKNHLLENYVLL